MAAVARGALQRRVTASVPVRVLTAWDRYWFGQVAAIRPYLLMKILLGMLAFDVWMLRVPLGGRYGAGAFGVAHFGWLDAVQPLPSPRLYVGLMLAIGMLAVVCALADAGRWMRALLAAMYTYGWAMSFHDTYQHHYLLSLVLATFVFFPRLHAADLYPAHAWASRRERRRVRLEPSRRTLSAWAYALLGANLAIVYAYTAVTKWDTGWRAGAVVEGLAEESFGPLAAWMGLGAHSGIFWVVLGLGVFAAECVIAVGYLLAVRLDDRRGRWLPAVTGLAFLAAVGFHVAAEVGLSLRIGWFSYYMMVFACVYFLPSSLLWAIGAPLRWLVAAWSRVRDGVGTLGAGLTLLAVGLVAIVVSAVGLALDLPGTRTVGFVGASTLVAGSVLAVARRREHDALRYAVATGLAAALMWGAVGQSNVRFVYHANVATDLQRRGDPAGALDALEKASRYAPNPEALQQYMVKLRRQLGRPED